MPFSRKNLALLVLCLASFMAVVVDTIVTIALPSMRRDLGFSGADARWNFNGYMLEAGLLVAAATVGGQAAGPDALVGGLLRWGLLACVGFAVLAVPVVLFVLRGEEASSKSAL